MANLDVSDILDDPDFLTGVQLKQRVRTIGDDGRSTVVETVTDIFAVVTQGSLAPLTRSSDFELARKNIVVHSRTRLRGPQAGYEPDIVVWKGLEFVVTKSYDWSDFGQGYTAAECDLLATTEEP